MSRKSSTGARGARPQTAPGSEARNPARGARPGHAAAPAATEQRRERRFVTTTVEVEGREETKVVEVPAFEPTPWDDAAVLRVVGARVPRVDALAKVTGSARYTADLQHPGMAYAVILRAPIARGSLGHLDVERARAMPGVRDVIVQADVPEVRIDGHLLFDSAVRYAGQPIAAVCADSLDAALAAREAMVAEYSAEPHAVTAAAALAPGAPSVRGTGNRSEESPMVAQRGDAARGLRDAEVVIEREYRTPVALHTALEPHGAVADWSGEHLTVWESTQGIFRVRDDVAAAFGLPLTHVRVIKDYMGGGFGAKNAAGAHTYVAATFARRLGVAVRCINDREAEQTDAGNRPATVQRVTLGARRDGTLTAIVLEALIPLGVGGWEGGPGKLYHEMYACPNVRTTETFVYVNTGAMSSFRAPGHVEGAFALERALDVLARELGLDPLAVRLRNYAERDQEKSRPYSSKRLRECYEQGAARFGWWTRDGRGVKDDGGGVAVVRGDAAPGAIFTAGGAPRTAMRTRYRRGFGVASQIWGAGGGPPAYAIVKLNSDGTADVLAGTQDLGTGARTILAQVAAEALGSRLADVRVVLGDTERAPYAPNSWGSMTTPSVAPAVRMAAEDARQQLLEAAAEILDTTPDRLEASDGVIRQHPGKQSISFRDLAERLGDVMIIGRGNRGPNPEQTAIASFGAQFAEVEVDLETGVVRVVRIVAAHDAGRVINPTLAESQLEGGIIQGLGYALFEERVLDERLGVPLNPTMHDYKIPTLADIPRIDAFCVEATDAVANHTGAKGLAEPPIIPAAPAIANAVADAIGAEVCEIPLTPWRVLKAMAGN